MSEEAVAAYWEFRRIVENSWDHAEEAKLMEEASAMDRVEA